MELNPREVMDNTLGPVVNVARNLGHEVIKQSNEIIGVFARPQDAFALAEDQIMEKIHEDEMLYELESGLADHETHFKFSQRIFTSALERLKLPEEEMTEDDLLNLKRVKKLYEDFPLTSAGLLGLPPEDRSLILDFLVPEERFY